MEEAPFAAVREVHLVCRMAFAGMRHGDVMATMRFFGQAVIPELRMVAFPTEIRRRTRA